MRGLNHPHKHDILANLVRDHRLDIVLIQETKMGLENLSKLKHNLFKDCGMHCSDAASALRGIVTFWNLKFV